LYTILVICAAALLKLLFKGDSDDPPVLKIKRPALCRQLPEFMRKDIDIQVLDPFRKWKLAQQQVPAASAAAAADSDADAAKAAKTSAAEAPEAAGLPVPKGSEQKAAPDPQQQQEQKARGAAERTKAPASRSNRGASTTTQQQQQQHQHSELAGKAPGPTDGHSKPNGLARQQLGGAGDAQQSGAAAADSAAVVSGVTRSSDRLGYDTYDQSPCTFD
jgi:hypothetical protein